MAPELLAGLRELCREYGDNDWPDNLDPLTVVELHLTRPLYSRLEGLRRTVATLTERNANLEGATGALLATLERATMEQYSPTGG